MHTPRRTSIPVSRQARRRRFVQPPAQAHAARRGGLQRRDRGQQLAGVVLARPVEHLVARALLDDGAVAHDHHAIGHLLHHAQVVADEQAGKAVPRLQVGEQVQHLRPHRHVQRRHRFVRDHEGRPPHHRPRDRHALALAARQLVRIAAGVFRAQADLGQHLVHAPALVLGGQAAQHAQPSPTSSPMVMRGSSENTDPGTPSGN